MGGVKGQEGFDVPHQGLFVLAGKSRYKVCGKSAGKQGGNQGEAFRKQAPLSYPVNHAAGRLVKGLYPQAYAAYPALPAGAEERPVRGFGVGLQGNLFRPCGKEGPEAGKEARCANSAQNRRGTAAYIQGGNPVYGETGQAVPDISQEDAHKGIQPGIKPGIQPGSVRTDRKGVKVAVVARAGTEGYVKVEGGFHCRYFTGSPGRHTTLRYWSIYAIILFFVWLFIYYFQI
jgi:hypothetical protein